MDLTFKLESFEGPLELLFHLIEKNKIDIYDIPIALLTEQYLEYLDNMEKTDIRDVELCDVDIAVSDVSFISLTKIAQKVSKLLKSGGEFVALVKPQFECGKEIAKKCRGVVKDARVQEQCKNNVIGCYQSLGFRLVGVCESPILGGDGNLEFLSYFVKI